MIRNVKESDALQISEIYNHYIRNTAITFEEAEIKEDDIIRRIKSVTEEFPWIINEEEGIINGYAYSNRWKERSAYRYSAENTVYVHKDHFGKGIGKMLLQELIVQLKKKGIHSILAGIAMPNEASIVLHEKCGFIKCGTLKEVGFKFGKWVDVGYWEKIL
ncbi:MAG TPA: N-acetyltransferase family protein [Ignavibacteria bacterium]|nr:N-acetyltransferase family protein [Ignavibacteria bacterium]